MMTRGLAVLLTFTLLGLGMRVMAAEKVDARLNVPPAEAYVLGDSIPLLWWFTNTSDHPIAFMWEGCCRLNGRLTVEKNSQAIEVIPPGPSTAHRFPKAARIQPESAEQFQSLLSDWVVLPEGGQYTFRGSYVGVLPNQRPLVPPSLQLWRGKAVTPEMSLSVLAVSDYLAQRPERSRQRGLALELLGPDRFNPLGATTLQIRFRNVSDRPQTFAWPGTVEVWMVPPNGRRAAGAPRFLRQSGEEIRLEPGAAAEREVTWTPHDLEDLPWSDYTVFLDLGASDDSGPRVPSTALGMTWTVQESEVRHLLIDAADKPQVGSKNPSLKLMRVFLSEMQSALQHFVPTLTNQAAVDLGKELLLAACLKPAKPAPGKYELHFKVKADGPWSFADPNLTACFPAQLNNVQAVDALLEVRRHLGWYVHPVANPDPDARIGDLLSMTDAFTGFQSKFGSPLSAEYAVDSANVTNTVVLSSAPVACNMILRLRPSGAGGPVVLEYARRLPDPAQPQLVAQFNPEDVARATFMPLVNAEALEAVLEDGKLRFPRALIVADPRLTWSEVTQAAHPLLARLSRTTLTKF